MEKKIQFEMMQGINTDGMSITVLELVEKYISTKLNVRINTKAGYQTVVNILKKDRFGLMKIFVFIFLFFFCFF